MGLSHMRAFTLRCAIDESTCAVIMRNWYECELGYMAWVSYRQKRPIVVIIFILESANEFYEYWSEFRAYLSGPAVLDAPAGDSRSAATRRDDEVAFVWNESQGGDAVEAEEAHAHSVQIATCNSWRNLLANSAFSNVRICPISHPITDSY